ncbi:uncharacterized protein [Battus philenor]|uniref:uncharacterized protein n=1 Tax=Battus philenor TaxID=42288 RepID=UPI0035D12232
MTQSGLRQISGYGQSKTDRVYQIEEVISGKSRVEETTGDGDEQSRQTNTNQKTEDSDEVLVMESSEDTAVSARSEDTNTEPKYDKVPSPTDTNVPVDSNTHIDQMTSDWVKKWLNTKADEISPGTHTPQTFTDSLNHKGVLSKQVIRDVSRSMNQSPDYDQMTCDWLKKLVNTPVEEIYPVPQTPETFTDSSNYEVMFRGSDRLTEKWLRNLHNSDPGTLTYK